MELISKNFNHNEMIPQRFTCDGDDISPELEVKNIPAKVKSFAIIMDDPDAPVGTFVHWVIYNISAHKNIIEEHLPKIEKFADGVLQGKNDFGKIGYGGPCPPKGKTHRYFIKLYGLDDFLDLPPGITKPKLESAMNNHLVKKTELIGLYKR